MIHSVIFDWKRTLYDPDRAELIDGALPVLSFLRSQGVNSYLIGKGSETMYDEVERLGVARFFLGIAFKDGDKNPDVFASVIDARVPRRTLVIGDRVKSEIAIGNQLGALTLQVKQGPFAAELPDHPVEVPDFEVESLATLRSMLPGLLLVSAKY